MTTFTLPIRVYYEDTDAGGVVYYANYLKFMERARTEYLRTYGFEQDELAEKQKVLFVVHRVEADYVKSARFNELLTVTAEIVQQKRTSLLFEQQVLRNNELCCKGVVRVVCVNSETFRPAAIPESILSVINEQ